MSKRAHGEGSVVKRPNGRWAGVQTLPDGKRKWHYAKTQAEAVAKLKEAIRRVEAGQTATASVETVGAFLTRWLEDVKRSNVSPGTYITYEGIIRKHLNPALGATRLPRLTAPQVQKMLGDLGRAGLAPSTINTIHVVLHGALKQAMRWDLVPRNVAALVSPPRIERSQARYFNEAQARTFLAAVNGHALEALFVLAITSGMREGELLGLRWADVDLGRRTVRVAQALRRDYVGRALGDPKSDSSRRQIGIPEVAVTSLRQHRARQAEIRLAAPDWTDNDLVFPARTGRPYKPQTLRERQFYPLLEAAGLPRIWFHDLRDTFATLNLAQGTGLKVISEMLGHSGIGVTADRYLHVSEEMQRQAADRLDGLFGPARGAK